MAPLFEREGVEVAALLGCCRRSQDGRRDAVGFECVVEEQAAMVWRLAAEDRKFIEARGRARQMYRHNVRRADGLVGALRPTTHYCVELRDGRRVAALRQRRDGGYRFETATRLNRRLSAAPRERFGIERFYDPDTDAIVISNLVHDFEAASRTATARTPQSDYGHQARLSQPLGSGGDLIAADRVAKRQRAFPTQDDDSAEQ